MTEIVAEFTTNHFGHVGLLCRMVEAAADAGADSIKMQKKDVESFYTKEKLGAPFASPFGRTYRDYRLMFELARQDWARFDAACSAAGIPWFYTAQDDKALATLAEDFAPWRVKIASSNARNWDFLELVRDTIASGCEVVLSVGGSTLDEIERAVKILKQKRRLWLLHCVAEYPCPDERLRLGNISELIKRFGGDDIHVGYSGHEVGVAASVAAVTLGAEMLERHFCLSRHSFVHHIECSLEPHELRDLVSCIRIGNDATGMVPPAALESKFGMSDRERAFLVDQNYGRRFLGKRSRFGDNR